jgi:crotonobetainyl-CoA:carnitine CoA-transferase CaiB-like acyl-CoA transferase
MPEALAEAQTASRGLFHTFAPEVTGLARGLTIPLAPFRLAYGGPRAETPPRPVGADTDAVLGELGYAAREIAGLRQRGVV